MTSKELNKSKEEIDVLLENLKQVETILKAYKFDLESSREIIDELDNENKKLKKAMEIIIKEKVKPSAFIGMLILWKNNYGEEMPFEEASLQLDFNGTKEEYENLKEVLYEQRIIRR